MADRLTPWLGLALMLVMGVAQVASCGRYRCNERDIVLVESGEHILILDGQVHPDYADLVGAQLIIDRDTETSTIRYTRDGTTYEVRHSLTNQP